MRRREELTSTHFPAAWRLTVQRAAKLARTGGRHVLVRRPLAVPAHGYAELREFSNGGVGGEQWCSGGGIHAPVISST